VSRADGPDGHTPDTGCPSDGSCSHEPISNLSPLPPGRLPAGRWLGRVFWFYRAGISPLLGPSCRYEPSCSHYAEQAIAEWGVLRGIALGIWRILRCHPFARGGLDPVPPKGTGLVGPARGRAANW
jgi:putative membrane protein insertion efficiency factor